MSDKSKIEWTEATWNPVTGCTKVSQGCKNCYAERDWARLSQNPKTVYHGREFTDVQCHPERLNQPLRWRKPRRVFVNSMSDLFHENVPFDFIDMVFATMSVTKAHTYQILTKRPERMATYLSADATQARIDAALDFLARKHGWCACELETWPLENVWLGVSVEDQATADERIPLLVQTPAAVKWISAEPLLGELDLSHWLMQIDPYRCGLEDDPLARVLMNQAIRDGCGDGIRCLDWVVAGGESGYKARPTHPDWALSLLRQCVEAGVPFLWKQWGTWGQLEGSDAKGSGAKHPTPIVFWREGKWHQGMTTEETAHMVRVGKKAAGRLLDGKLWDQYPNEQTN